MKLALVFSMLTQVESAPYSCSLTTYEPSLAKDRCFEMDFNFHKDNRIKLAPCPEGKICRIMRQEDKFEWPFNAAQILEQDRL